MLHGEHEQYMEEALKMAEKAAVLGDIPAGAIIVQGDQIIARGYNTRETNEDATGHAEIMRCV